MHDPSPLASSMFAPGVPYVLEDFHSTSIILASFVVSIYLIGYAAGPLLCAPLSEVYGRFIVYVITNVFFVIFTIACAVAPSLNSLIGFRFLAGAAGSAPLVLGGGSVADLYKREERGSKMAIFAMGPLLGPVIGPVAGAFLAEAEGWRWVFWVITIAVSYLIADNGRGTNSSRVVSLPLLSQSSAAKLTLQYCWRGRQRSCARRRATTNTAPSWATPTQPRQSLHTH